MIVYMDNEFVFSILGFGFKICMMFPPFLSCKQILDNIKDEIKQEIKDKEKDIKMDVPAVNILDDDSI